MDVPTPPKVSYKRNQVYSPTEFRPVARSYRKQPRGQCAKDCLSTPPEPPGTRVRWSNEELTTLRKYGDATSKDDRRRMSSWNSLASRLPGRTGIACRTKFDKLKKDPMVEGPYYDHLGAKKDVPDTLETPMSIRMTGIAPTEPAPTTASATGESSDRAGENVKTSPTSRFTVPINLMRIGTALITSTMTGNCGRTTCVLCLTPHPGSFYNFQHEKCLGKKKTDKDKDDKDKIQIVGKIEQVLGVEVASLQSHPYAGVCLPCFNRIDRFYDYKMDSIKGLEQYKSSLRHIKKLEHFSPATPTPGTGLPPAEPTDSTAPGDRTGNQVNSSLAPRFTVPVNHPPPVSVPTPHHAATTATTQQSAATITPRCMITPRSAAPTALRPAPATLKICLPATPTARSAAVTTTAVPVAAKLPFSPATSTGLALLSGDISHQQRVSTSSDSLNQQTHREESDPQVTDGFRTATAANYQADEKPCTCSVFGRQFPSAGDIRKQMSTHTKLYQCSDCGKHFGHAPTLRKHMMIHTAERALTCPMCGRLFRDSDQLQNLMMTHTGVETHLCPPRGKQFSRSNDLERHLVSFHTERCVHCAQEFRDINGLRSHMVIHTGQNYSSCATCVKGFTQTADLLDHLGSHIIVPALVLGGRI